ncbi:hypothetical protein PV08_11759 [Exophiala spinifera]|uniref:Transcription factor domain-containing protein n=1 Tax=Exophiala spinifera TaxID=91928 RepID=A0A0D2ATF3_9EURO|nr:uncharacterized protein PV08_11759 [Exophiala spinifera]KIW09983.1 hypothetical protein PV08_11759 [Exophiala spinifera]
MVGGSSERCHEHGDLLDYLFRNVLGQFSGTSVFKHIAWPGLIVARHMLLRKLPCQVLLAISSLYRDLDAGRQDPTSETIAFMLGGIQLLKEQLQTPDTIDGDSILTMTGLWMYEAVLRFEIVDWVSTRPTTTNTESSLQSIQAHLDGLRRSIAHIGGLKYLPPEAMWSVAWCVASLPGYWTLDAKMTEDQSISRARLTPGSQCSLTRLVDFLTRIERLASSTDFQPNILQETSFSLMRRSLLRLVQMPTNQRTVLKRMMRSTSMLSIMLFTFDVLLGGSKAHIQPLRERQREMMRLQDRLDQHNIDQEGSPQLAWQILMTEKETPHVQLHPRAWPIVEMVNEVKHLSVATIDSMSKLLIEWMFPRDAGHVADFRYERLLLQIHYELDGVAGVL